MEVGEVVPRSELSRRGTDTARFYTICEELPLGVLRSVEGMAEQTLRARASNYNRTPKLGHRIRVRKLIGGGFAIEKVAA